MTKAISVVAAIAIVTFFVQANNAYATPYTFDADNEGWDHTYVGRSDGAGYDRLYANTPADWTGAEGNPPGSIYQTVGAELDQRAYWMGIIDPPNPLGDLMGQTLQTDIRSTHNWRTIANGSGGDDGNVYARWVIANEAHESGGDTYYNMFISKRTVSIDVNTLTGWETKSVELIEDNFLRWPNYDAGTQDFAELLADYDQVGIYIFSGTDNLNNINGGDGTWETIGGVSRLLHYGAYSSDGEDATWGLDNLTAVPEPTTLALLVLAGLGVTCRRREKKRSGSRAA